MTYIGNQTACWTNTPTEPFEYALNQQFDAFEWFPDKKPGAGWDETDLDAGARQSIRQVAHERGMRLSVHARWQANPMAADGPGLLSKDLELARDVGAALVNIHLFHAQGVPAFLEAIVPLIEQTAEANLQLSIENTPEHSPEKFNEFFSLIRSLKSVPTQHVGMCLDLGHANLCSATRNDYLAFIDRLESQVPIIHLHFHENWGDSDSHLPLFTGPAARDDSGIRAIVARLKDRDFSGSIILEQWPNPPSLLNQARERLLKLWGANGQPTPGETTPAPQKTPAAKSEPATPTPPLKASAGVVPDDFISELAEGDRRCQSWREKLEFARTLLGREQPPITSTQLIDLAVYLRFLGTGELHCEEDGRHFRPAHHARISAEIQERLARLKTDDNNFVIRRIYPWLPSSGPDFRRTEPLTRIRDIAHRNDIDSELKREIKTRLQNKLHRCAGPEDLQTSSALLARITASGAKYSPDFVQQFRIFHDELKEFFNARSLDDRIRALEASNDTKQTELVRLFLEQKTGRGPAERLKALHALTALREHLMSRVDGKSASEAQDLLLTDISLEDFAFVLFSELINGCEHSPPREAADLAGQALAVAVQNLELGCIKKAEARAIRNELLAWGELSDSSNREEVLRAKATLLRCRRLAETFSETLVTLFSDRAQQVGNALGVAQHAIRVFSESDLRSHLVFQISKLTSMLLRDVRRRLGSAAWDVLVGGRAKGQLIAPDTLENFERRSGQSFVVLLNSAAGDEEIPNDVSGIVLGHDMPHLSHLSVRARQAGVVFVACEEVSELEELRKLEGKTISIEALPDSVTWEVTDKEAKQSARKQRSVLKIPEAQLSSGSNWLPLDQVTVETSGGKASGMRQLTEVSLPAARFETPAMAIPFGVMESALAALPAVQKQYRELANQLDSIIDKEIATATQRLRELVQQLNVPEAIVSEARRQFGAEVLLAVRSSANCEDLEQLAGAGLHESVLGVKPKDLAAAIRTVWASLWTERATLSRREARIPQSKAHMAVLVQEMINPDFSFVLHTINPISHNERELYAELVVGLGETLVSGAERGIPYRLSCDKQSGEVIVQSFANFSHALRANQQGGVQKETIDYSQIRLSQDIGALRNYGALVAEVGKGVEQALGRPQDIEGVLVNDRIILVQARPQQGV